MDESRERESQAGWPVVHVVGIGDEGAACLRPDVAALVREADLLCGGERHLTFFPAHRAEKLVIKRNVEEVCETLQRTLGSRRAIVLASGDPCFYGIGPIITERLGADHVVIHPQPSAVSLAFARLGLAWQEAAVLSAHGRPLAGIIGPALAASRFAVLTDARNTPGAVARALLAAGMEDACAHILEHLGGPRERRIDGTLAAIAAQEFAPLNVLIVDREPERVASRAAVFGLDEADYASERGQITKAEVRAVTLSKLEPWRAQVTWDVGAGSGSVALELAGLMPAGVVYAVERDATQLAVLQRNLLRFSRPNVQVVAGEAPAALRGLPAPDAVFIGGSGGTLAPTLTAVTTALRAGGRIVANFAQLESLTLWQQHARELGWPQELLQISVARGIAIAGGTRLAPLGPVFVTVLRRQDGSESEAAR
jgi:precorrin-6Y C5,15-methyltransferase (decarboxylating)